MESMAALKHEGAMWRERALYVVRSNSQLVRQQMVCLPACLPCCSASCLSLCALYVVRSNSQLVRQHMVCLRDPAVRSNSQLVRQQMVCLPGPLVRSDSQLVRQQMVCLPGPLVRSDSQLVQQQMVCCSAWCLSVLSSLVPLFLGSECPQSQTHSSGQCRAVWVAVLCLCCAQPCTVGLIPAE